MQLTYITYNHFDLDTSKISALVDNKNSKIYGATVGELVGYEDEDGVTNLSRIYSRYRWNDYDMSVSDFESKAKADIAKLKSIPISERQSFVPMFDVLKTGTVLKIPVDMLQRRYSLYEYSDRYTNEIPFWKFAYDAEVRELEYRGYIDSTVMTIPKFVVLVYSHNLQELINISPYISTLSLNKQQLGGKITMRVKIAMIKSDLYQYYMTHRNLEQDNYINNFINRRDIVYVKFGDIDNISHGIVQSKSIILNNDYDAIGYINSKSTSLSASDAPIILSAELLDSMLTKDNSAIYSRRIISNGKESGLQNFDGGLMRFGGKFISKFSFSKQTIESNIRFIIDYQSRMKLSEEFFSIYPSRNKFDLPDFNLINRQTSGVWNAIDVFVDKFVSHYRLYNSDIGNSTESLISQMKNVCSDRFVDLRTDFYGNKLYIIARKPPFDYESVKRARDDKMTVEVKDYSVVSTNLDISQEAYSWYYVEYDMLKALFKDDKLEWFMPAIHFPEYADIFGDKNLTTRNRYMTIMEKTDDNRSRSKLASIVLQDLRFLIETHMYLPFTLSGTINMNKNWRIRNGSWIKYNDFLFYVDNVTHNIGITGKVQATTTLNVSRGMYIQDIRDCFSVINLSPIDRSEGEDFVSYIKRTLSSWTVNRDKFDKLLNTSRNYNV